MPFNDDEQRRRGVTPAADKTERGVWIIDL